MKGNTELNERLKIAPLVDCLLETSYKIKVPIPSIIYMYKSNIYMLYL